MARPVRRSVFPTSPPNCPAETPPRSKWETKETLEGGLRIDRMWWAAVKVGGIVAVGVLVGAGAALALL